MSMRFGRIPWPLDPGLAEKICLGLSGCRRLEVDQLLVPSVCCGDWLSDMDSNHDKGLQRALCYHYTIGQARGKLSPHGGRAKEKLCRSAPKPDRKSTRL